MKKPIFAYLLSFTFFMVLLVLLIEWRADFKNKQRAAQTLTNSQEMPEVHETPDSSQTDSTGFFIQEVNLETPTERVLAVQECGTCHQEAYENWKAGPHAASFSKLRTSLSQIQHSAHFPEEYANWTEENVHICMGCHASKNIFENGLRGTEFEKDLNEISTGNFPDLFKMAEVRQDPMTWSTGTDCFTCHYNGERIVTRGDFQPQSSANEMPCQPLASPFFTTNTACTSCHGIHVEHVMRFAGNGQTQDLLNTETSCISCHQEYDAEGKGTHYFFWRHDDPQKHPRKVVKGGIFQALKTRISNSGSNKTLEVEWANNLYPHNFSECGEIVVFLKLDNAQGKPVFATEVRINRKEFHDEHLRDQMAGQEPTGKMGYNFNPGIAPLHEVFPLPSGNYRGAKLHLKAIDKGQYWADDAIGEEIFAEVRDL